MPPSTRPTEDTRKQYGVLTPERLEHTLGSPLRLRLLAEILSSPDRKLRVEDAVLKSGRHVQDVVACLQPLVGWRVLEVVDGGYRLRGDLQASLRDTIERVVTARHDQLARERHVRHQILSGMIGFDPKMQLVFEMIAQVARLDVSVLVTGETGTGKELVAKAIHNLGNRRAAKFGAVNCATLTESLFESELFGHARGAFTGAFRDHMGLVEQCDGGTLFLDEIGELSLNNQVKLLRVLQEGTFARVGDNRVRRSDFRLISATNRELGEMIREGTFREDLYYRINVFPIRLPSLRERMSDLPYLVDGILQANAGEVGSSAGPPEVHPTVLERLRRHHWPGNVRELENVILRAAIMAEGGPIGVEHLPRLTAQTVEAAAVRFAARRKGEVLRPLKEVEREHIADVLGVKEGNIKASAKVLGISRTTLYKKIKRYKIDVDALAGSG